MVFVAIGRWKRDLVDPGLGIRPGPLPFGVAPRKALPGREGRHSLDTGAGISLGSKDLAAEDG